MPRRHGRGREPHTDRLRRLESRDARRDAGGNPITGPGGRFITDETNLIRGFSGTAAVSLDGISRENLDDFLSASALLGLRYQFN